MKKPALIIFTATLFFSLFSFLVASHALGGAADVRRVTKEDLRSHLNDPDTTIIDVRQEGDWQGSDLKIK